jgi:enamine deaminase RidA (YjgF/YER057c/UK114 family)
MPRPPPVTSAVWRLSTPTGHHHGMGAEGEIELINPPGLEPAVGFSHASAGGGMVWMGGQTASDAQGRILHPGDMAAQFGAAIRNLGTVLAAAGCRPEDLVKLTYLVTDVGAYRRARKEIGAAYREVLGKHFPAATLVEVKGLYEAEAMVEIEGIAVRRQP